MMKSHRLFPRDGVLVHENTICMIYTGLSPFVNIFDVHRCFGKYDNVLYKGAWAMEKSLIRGWPLIIWGGGRGADFHDRNFLFNSDHAPPR